MVVCPGDIHEPSQRTKLDSVGKALASSDSFLHRFTPPGAAFSSVFEILAVHSAPRVEVTVFDFPEVFRHYDEVAGYDYWKIYVDDMSYHEGHGKFYETFGISEKGCIIVIRPDQYVSYVGPMEDVEAVNKFFSGFMRAPKGGSSDLVSGGITNGAVASGPGTNGTGNGEVLADEAAALPM